MTQINSPYGRGARQQPSAGRLLAGFLRAGDAEMARLALADRGYDMNALQRLSDQQMLLEFGQATDGGNSRSADQPKSGALDCCWLLVAVDDDDVDIVAEYLRACGAEQIVCKVGSSNAIMQAHSALVQRLIERHAVAVASDHHAASPVPEFHPVSWSSWTQGPAGAGND